MLMLGAHRFVGFSSCLGCHHHIKGFLREGVEGGQVLREPYGSSGSLREYEGVLGNLGLPTLLEPPSPKNPITIILAKALEQSRVAAVGHSLDEARA